LAISWKNICDCLTSKRRSCSSDFSRSVDVDGCRFRITIQVGLSLLSWEVWYWAFCSLKKCISHLYDSGLVVCILIDQRRITVEIVSPISSTIFAHMSEKFIIPLTKIGWGGLIWLTGLNISGIVSGAFGLEFRIVMLLVSVCISTSLRLAVMNNFLFYSK